MPADPRTPAARVAAELKGRDGLRLLPGVSLARLTTFRIGGPAELLVEADSEAALRAVVAAARRHGARLQVLGLGSNVLFPDRGLEGVVLRLTGELREIRFSGRRVVAGAGAPLSQLARRASGQGLIGLENLAGFPSTVGGAVVMNAGSYGSEIADVLIRVRVVDAGGAARDLTVDDLEPGYRTTRLQGSDQIVAEAELELARGDAARALARIQELHRKRWSSLPSGHPNVGSIFRNPPGDAAGRLIDACGLKGRRRGDAQISPQHGNVIVNLGEARAADVLELMREARAAVRRSHGVELEPEVVLTGELHRRFREG